MLTAESISRLCAPITDPEKIQSIYCLADHGGISGLHRELVRSRTEWINLFHEVGGAQSVSIAPLLFRITPSPSTPHNANFLAWVAEHGRYTSSLIFLASPESLTELASRLVERLQGMISEEMNVLVRFYDPRIFERLMTVLSMGQRQSFLSAASRWWFTNRQGNLQTVNAEFSVNERFLAPLRLSSLQEAALLDASEPDQVAELLRTSVPELFAAVLPQEQHAFIIGKMDEARNFNITATHEVALYCALLLQRGPEYGSSADFKAMLLDVKEGRTCFSDALATTDKC